MSICTIPSMDIGRFDAGENGTMTRCSAARERISAAFFLGGRLDATVPKLRLPPGLASQARGPERDPNNPLFREVDQNYLKGRLRSHPDVAQRYFADLIRPEAPAQASSSH